MNAAAFSIYLCGAGRNYSGPVAADHYPSEDVDGRQVRYLGHHEWHSTPVCLNNWIIPRKLRQEYCRSSHNLKVHWLTSFQSCIKGISALIVCFSDAWSEKSKSLEADFFAVIMFFYAISFARNNQPPAPTPTSSCNAQTKKQYFKVLMKYLSLILSLFILAGSWLPLSGNPLFSVAGIKRISTFIHTGSLMTDFKDAVNCYLSCKETAVEIITVLKSDDWQIFLFLFQFL